MKIEDKTFLTTAGILATILLLIALFSAFNNAQNTTTEDIELVVANTTTNETALYTVYFNDLLIAFVLIVLFVALIGLISVGADSWKERRRKKEEE